MAVLTIGHTFVDGQQVTSTRLNNTVNAATFASAAVDGTTTQLSSGAIIVKDLGISTGKIAASAVTTAKLATDSVSTAKIIDSNITKAKIEDFTNLTVLGNVSGSAATPAEVTIIDDDTMGTASATTLATSESVKAYVDTQIGANNDLSEILANGNETGSNNIIVTAGQAITTDTVSETTDTAGVTVDSLLIKDGGITAAGTSTFAGQTISDLGTVTTANIDGGSIDGTTVGASSASTGAFTTLTASDDVNFDSGTLFVDASADRVGIGTTSPAKKLEISSNANGQTTADIPGIRIENTDTTVTDTNVAGEIEFFSKDSSEADKISGFIKNVAEDAGTKFALTFGAKATGANAAEAMRIDADGNVGIGTTSPSNTLHVENTTSSGAYINYDGQSNTEFGLRVESNASGGNFESDFGAGGTALLDLYANSASVTGGDILVARTQSSTPVLLVKGNGKVGIGTTSPGHTLDVSGEFRVNGGGTGTIVVNDEDSSLCPTMTFLRNGGGTTTNDFIKFENSGGEVAAINASGGGYFSANVGIGQASPSKTLVVNENDSECVIVVTSSDSGTAGIYFGDQSDEIIGGVVFDNSTDKLQLRSSNNNTAVTIDSSERVGIGDTTPSYRLDVNGTGHFVNDLTLDEELIHNLSGSGSLPGYNAGTFGAVLEDGGSNGSSLYMSRKNSWALYLATDTTLNAQSDKVVVFADLNGQSGDQDNVVGDITITSTSTSYNESSDYRLKENEVTLADGIDRLKQLKPYRFNFKRDADTTVDGFFAHEVQDVVPEAVRGEKDAMKDQEYEVSPAVYDDEGELVTERVMGTRSVPDYQGIDKSKLVPLLTAALQEAVAKIEALEARVQTLEG